MSQIYAIGLPGQTVRHFVGGMTQYEIVNQLLENEIAILIDSVPMGSKMISQDGKSLVDVEATLDELKSLKWDEAKIIRDDIATSWCMTPLGPVDIDEDSQRKINGAVNGALISQMTNTPFEVEWTMYDNSVKVHTGAQLIVMGMTVMEFIHQCQVAGNSIRQLIDNANSGDQLNALDLTVGYPARGPA